MRRYDQFFLPKAFILEYRKETDDLAAIVQQTVERERFLTIDRLEIEGSTFYEKALTEGGPEDPPVHVSGADPFLIMITSGTTSFPKACSIDHETYSLRSLNYAITRGYCHDERALLTLPVHFNAGRGSAMGLLYLGGTIFIEERFEEKRFLEIIEGEKISYTILVPTLCERLLRCGILDRFDTSLLAFVGITGGHLSNDSAKGIMERLCPKVYEAYASTDCGQISLLAPGDRFSRPNSVGRPIWCVQLKFADEDGQPAKVCQEGEICVRTPLAIQGYYQNPDATNEFFRGGWCHTGDIGFLDEQGYLYISGRKKSMVKSGGISVFPEEIENTLRGHQKVADVAVVGFKSPEWGEAVKAFVVLSEGASCEAESLIEFCKQSLASYKAPKIVEFVPSLPRTGLGKIDRARLEAVQILGKHER